MKASELIEELKRQIEQNKDLEIFVSSSGFEHEPLVRFAKAGVNPVHPGSGGADYLKEVDTHETTLRFWQEIYDEQNRLVEIHEKYPVDKGHQKV
jgi:hypothetical protein